MCVVGRFSKIWSHILCMVTCVKQACKLAIDGGWAVNLGGGFGYNTPRISKGLAVYDDIPVCLAVRLRVYIHIL